MPSCFRGYGDTPLQWIVSPFRSELDSSLHVSDQGFVFDIPDTRHFLNPSRGPRRSISWYGGYWYIRDCMVQVDGRFPRDPVGEKFSGQT